LFTPADTPGLGPATRCAADRVLQQGEHVKDIHRRGHLQLIDEKATLPGRKAPFTLDTLLQDAPPDAPNL
jgi:hypothetical protein